MDEVHMTLSSNLDPDRMEKLLRQCGVMRGNMSKYEAMRRNTRKWRAVHDINLGPASTRWLRYALTSIPCKNILSE